MEAGAEGSEEGQAGPGHRLTAAAPYLVVTAVALWLTRAFWMPGGYVVGFDTYAYSGPNLEITERALRRWDLPLVDDLIFGGVPHLGNPSAAALYPPNLLSLLVETNRAMGLIVTTHVVLLGIGTVVLCRRLGLGRVGAGGAAVVAVAAGATLTKTVQFEQILVIAWIPWLLASIHGVLTARRPWSAVAAVSVTTAGILLAGHPQLVYEAAVLALVTTVGIAWDGARWRRLGHLAGGAALGVGIALPQLVAVLYATADSAISGGRDLDALRSPALSLPRQDIARAVLGTVQDRDPAAFASGFESIVFIGVVVAMLAVIGAVALVAERPTRPWAIAFTGMAAVALSWSTGPRSPLFRAAFEIVPGFDLARASSRWLVVFALVAAVFAGAGAQAVWEGARRRHLASAVVASLVIVLALATGLFETADRRSATIWAVTAIVALVLLGMNATIGRRRVAAGAAVALLVVAGLELATMSVHSIPQRMRGDAAFTSLGTETTAFLAEQDGGSTIALTDDERPADYQVPGLRPNTNVLFGIPSIDGYDGGVQITERWADALRRFTADPPTELPLRNSLTLPVQPAALGRLGVRFVLLDRARPAEVFIPGWSGPRASDGTFDVWENPSWRGDAVAWPAAIADADPAELLRESPWEAARAAIVDDPADAFACEGGTCEPTRLAVRRPVPERIEIDVASSSTSIISVHQQALPGWSVEVDGRSAEVLVVDGLFLGVRVPAGDHTITFVYRSPWLAVTLLISVAAIAATFGLLVTEVIRARRNRPDRRRDATAGATVDDPDRASRIGLHE